jgi:hypothetical protein
MVGARSKDIVSMFSALFSPKIFEFEFDSKRVLVDGLSGSSNTCIDVRDCDLSSPYLSKPLISRDCLLLARFTPY